jgi:ATP-binding cassette subfamily B protein
MGATKQYLRSDCAASCIAHIARHHGLGISTATARRLAGTTRAGTTALGLVQAAERLGFTAKGVKGDLAFLGSCPKPAIAHVRLPSGRTHYVVVTKAKGSRIRVFDPADGSLAWQPIEAFAATWTGVAIIMAPGEKFVRGDRSMAPVRRLFGLFSGHRAAVAQLLTAAILMSAIGLAMSFYVQRIVDDVIPGANRPLLNLLGVAIIVLVAVRLVFSWFQFILSAKLSQRIDATLILGYYRHLLRLPQSFFDTMRIGEMTSRVSDAIAIRSFLSSVFVSAVLNPVVLICSLGTMFLFSWKLALVTLTQVPLQVCAYGWLNWINRRYQRRIKELTADLNSQVTETLNTVSTVKRFSLERAAEAGTEARFVRTLRVLWRAGIEGYFCSALSGTGSQLYGLAILWYGSSLVLAAALTPGELMSCYTLSLYIGSAMAGLVGISSDIQQAAISADRLFEIMDEPPESEGGSVVLSPERIHSVTLENVTVRYPGRQPALRGVSVSLAPGRITVLTGSSGSGKSTLLAVLQRLYPVESGLIRIGGIDIDQVSTESLRASLSTLPQKIDLMSGSILANIAVGDPAPDVLRATELCAQVGILDFINTLPQKFDSALGEGGLSLSGGQRQKIALVRALYRRAPILLLDEPTAALDREASQRVVALLRQRRAEGAIVVVATHSRAVLESADSIFFFDRGAVAPLPPRPESNPPSGPGRESAPANGVPATLLGVA